MSDERPGNRKFDTRSPLPQTPKDSLVAWPVPDCHPFSRPRSPDRIPCISTAYFVHKLYLPASLSWVVHSKCNRSQGCALRHPLVNTHRGEQAATTRESPNFLLLHRGVMSSNELEEVGELRTACSSTT